MQHDEHGVESQARYKLKGVSTFKSHGARWVYLASIQPMPNNKLGQFFYSPSAQPPLTQLDTENSQSIIISEI